MKALSIAWLNLRRVFRDRTGAFFMLVFPFLLILSLGSLFGSGFTPVVGVSQGDDTALARDLVERLAANEDLQVRRYDDRASLAEAVERGEAEAGLVIPARYDAGLRSGASLELPLIARPAGAGQQVAIAIEATIAEQAETVRAARFVEGEDLATFEDALARAEAIAPTIARTRVDVAVAGGEEPPGGFDFGAAQELILFVFVISLAASSMLIESRHLGVSRRMLASPTSATTVLLGEGLGRFAIALFEGLLIYVVTLLVFGVDWGDPVGGIAIVVLFALVGTGAAMLLGSLMRNAQQASSIGVFVGLGFAALGGCMAPLEIFPPVVRTIAHVTPHAWAIDGFDELLREGGTIADVVPELGVLAAYGAVLLAVATFAFRRRLTGAEASA